MAAERNISHVLLGWLNLLMAQVCIILMVVGVNWSIVYLLAAGVLISGLVLMGLVKKPKVIMPQKGDPLVVKVAFFEIVVFGLLAILLPVVNEFTAYAVSEAAIALSAIIVFYNLISATFFAREPSKSNQ